GKAYVAERDPDAADEKRDVLLDTLPAMGLSDTVEISHLLHAWEVLRIAGVSLDNGTAPKQPESEPASEKQMGCLADLADRKGFSAAEGRFTKAQASEIIDSLQNGTYDPAKYDLPF